MDDEIKGERNSLNYTFRMHDPRIGRFFARDPLESKYPFYSPYSFSGNKVISNTELEGLEEMLAIVDHETGQPKIMTTTGKELTMIIINASLDLIGDAASSYSIKIALAELSKGNLRTNTGKTYNTTFMTQKDIRLIDGTEIKKANIGKLFGNKINGITNTTKGINQVEAFRPNYLKNASEFLQGVSIVLDVGGWIDIDEKYGVNGSAMVSSAASSYVTGIAGGGMMGVASGGATALLMATVDYENRKNKEESNQLNFESLFNGKTSLSKAKNISASLFSTEIVNFAPNTIEKFLTGSIRELPDLYQFDAEMGDYSGESGALMFTLTNDNKALIHAVYVPEKKEK